MSSPTTSAPPAQASARTSVSSVVGVGVVIGFMNVAFLLSFAALLFAGAGAEYFARGAGFILIGAAVLNLVTARWSSMPGAVVTPQDTSTAIIAAALGGLVVGDVDSGLMAGSIVLYVMVCTGLTGLAMLLLGVFRRGGLIRFIPLPVIGGFLAGTGYLLVVGGAEVITAGFTSDGIAVATLTAAVAYALVLLVLVRRRPSVRLVPGAVIAGLAVFFVALAVSGTSIEEARGLGLLPAGGDSVIGLPFEALRHADWGILRSGLGGLLTVPLVATLAMLLNVSALELVGDTDADLDRDLRGVGVANLAAAFAGTSAGYHSLGLTALGYRVGVASRMVPVLVAGVCVFAAFVGGTVIAMIPTPLIGALLIFLGLGFVADWLVDARRQMSGPEVFLMVAIVVAVATIGFLAAVGLGMVAAVIIFVVAYSRIDTIRLVATGSDLRSTVDRPPAAEQILELRGDSILILELQGFLFFGTSRKVVERVVELLEGNSEVRCLVVDLRHVDGADSTAVAALVKLARIARRRSCRFVISGTPSSMLVELTQAFADLPDTTLSPDLDHALEVVEEVVIGDLVDPRGCTLGEVFGLANWDRIRPHLKVLRARAGEEVISFGESSVGILMVERGQIVTEIPTDEGWRRVKSSGPGAITGEMSLYRSGVRSARVVATEPSVLLSLDEEAIAGIEHSHPDVAVSLHRTLAAVLAERVATGNAAVTALLR